MFSLIVSIALMLAFASVFHLAWFLNGPKRNVGAHIDALLSAPGGAGMPEVLHARYQRLRPRSPVIAYLLTYLLGATGGYVYLGRPVMALLSLITLQGLGLWWLFALFAMPYLAEARNAKVAAALREGWIPSSPLGMIGEFFKAAAGSATLLRPPKQQVR